MAGHEYGPPTRESRAWDALVRRCSRCGDEMRIAECGTQSNSEPAYTKSGELVGFKGGEPALRIKFSCGCQYGAAICGTVDANGSLLLWEGI